jgi:hypothetical protein
MKLSDINEAISQIKLSFVSKLDKKIPSWSLQAGLTCPGSICPDTGEVKPSCKSCYAKKGNYTYPAAKNQRDHNKKDWKREDWVDDMVQIMGDYGRFRWFDSGDIYHPKLAEKIYTVIKRTPWITHWLPTMSHNVPKIAPWIDKIEQLPNAVVRRSSGNVDGNFGSEHGSTIIDKKTAQKWLAGEGKPKDVEVCPVGSTPDRKSCDGCRKCFDKKTKTIAYIKH